MSEEQLIKTPALTTEQRLQVRETQYQAYKLRDQAVLFQNQASQLDRQVVEIINKSAADLKVDSKQFTFDMDSLNFVRIK